MSKQMTLAVLSTLMIAGSLVAADRPNFVWLISEDNSKHYLKLFDEHGAETPAIEQLASQGLIFDHAFSNSPVCSVARTTLITSCFAPRIGTQFHRRSVLVPMPERLRMFPSYLRTAGYYTTNKFKKDYNVIEGAGVWDESSRNASWHNRNAEQPFFHKQSFATTHESRLHFSAQEMAEQPTKTDPATVFIAPYHPDTPTFRYTVARYHDRIQQVDREIGEVVDQLKAENLLEDTFVFYFGDHGGVLPRGKGYAYESGLHVPLVVRVPKNWQHLVPWSRGSRVKGFVSFVDFGPTLLRLADLEVPSQVDGRAFLGDGVTAEEVDGRDEAFGYADRFDEKYDLVRTLRKGRYEYVRSYQPFNFDALQNNYRYRMLAYREWRTLFRANQLNVTQSQFFRSRPAEALYDIEADPHESVNLAEDPQFSQVVMELRAQLSSLVKEMPDLSLFPESYLVETGFRDPVPFGVARKREIGRLVDLADLALSPFEDAEPLLAAGLRAASPWERYWSLVVCSSFGKQASPFAGVAKQLAAEDTNLLVKVRAAEFLGLLGVADPRPTILESLTQSQSAVEVSLILNSAVVLQDGEAGYPFQLSQDQLDPTIRDAENVARRLEYLAGDAAR